jgi:Protein of unknown function (DUF3887)
LRLKTRVKIFMKCHLRSAISVAGKSLSLSILSVLLVGGHPPLATVAAEVESPSIVAQDPDIQATAEKFVDALAVDDIEGARALVNPLVKKDWSEAMMRQSWQDLLAITGAFQERLSARVEDGVVIVNIQFENMTKDVIVIFDESGQITGFDFPQTEG